MPFRQLLNSLRIDAAISPTSLPFLLPDCPVQGNRPDKSVFVVIEDIGFRGTDTGVNLG